MFPLRSTRATRGRSGQAFIRGWGIFGLGCLACLAACGLRAFGPIRAPAARWWLIAPVVLSQLFAVAFFRPCQSLAFGVVWVVLGFALTAFSRTVTSENTLLHQPASKSETPCKRRLYAPTGSRAGSSPVSRSTETLVPQQLFVLRGRRGPPQRGRSRLRIEDPNAWPTPASRVANSEQLAQPNAREPALATRMIDGVAGAVPPRRGQPA
jgi:hypothetical protein